MPRRYFRLSFVLSFRSSFQHRRCLLQHHSAMHLLSQFLDFGVVSGHIRSSRLSAGAGLSGLGLFCPCPAFKPRDGRAARARGTRGSLRRTLVARPALAVAIPTSFASRGGWAKAARTENAAQKQGRSRGALSKRSGPFSPGIVSGPDQTCNSPLALASKIRGVAATNVKATMPSGGSPLAVLGVNLGHENGSEEKLSLPGCRAAGNRKTAF